MKILLFSALFFFNSFCFAQGELILNKISPDDSLNLMQSMGSLIRAVETKNVQTIRSACLDVVHCEMCITKPSEDAFVKSDTFAAYLVDSLRASGGWFNITAFGPEMSSTSSGKGGYHPKSVKLKPDEYFTEFELKYTIENTSGKYIFSFVKEREKFKLWAVRVSGY